MRLLTYIALLVAGALSTATSTAWAEEAPERETGPPGEDLADDGREWVEMGHGIRFGIGNTVMDVSQGTPRVAYVGTDVGYVYRSVDGGATWDEVRLLPDDRPLLNVPLMNPQAIPFPNNGLVDPYTLQTAPGTFRMPGMARSNFSPGPEGPAVPEARPNVPNVPRRYRLELQNTRVNGFALVGSGARVETEDPGNLMASFFSGVAAQPGRVNWLSICQGNPAVAFAGTNFGAFRTSNMGITWDRVFIGSSVQENWVKSVHCHPENSDVVVLATAQGIRISRDGGDQWDRPTGNLGNWPANFITTHPMDRRRLLVGTNIGAYETVTGAEEETVYLQDAPSPHVRIVWQVRGTTDENIMYVATNDGASYTHDGGETWNRVAEFLLGHYAVWAVVVDPRDPMHVYFQTRYHLFESHDGGQTLEMILWGYTQLKYTVLDPNDPDTLWLVGFSQVWRYSRPREQRPRMTEMTQRARQALERDPGHYAVMDQVLERAGLDPPTVQSIQRRMRYSSLVPTIDVVAWFNGQTGNLLETGVSRAAARSIFYTARCLSRVGVAWCPDSNPIDQRITDSFFEPYFAAFIVLSWPLGRVVMDERQTGRIWRDIFSMQNRVMYNVYDYWADRRRLLEFLADGTATDEEEVAYSLRLEEMTAVLDAMSGGMLGGPFGEQRRED